MTAPTAQPDPRLERLLGGPALASLRLRLRRWFERHARGAEPGSLLLTQLDVAEHDALALLTGTRSTATRSLRLDLAQLDARLQAVGIADSLRDALEHLDGAIAHPAAERSAARTAWSTLIDEPGRDTRLRAWLHTPSAIALLKRLARQDVAAAESLLSRACAVMGRLPAAGTPRAQLAAQTLGNAHALDASQPVATLVLAAWRHAEADEQASEAEPADDRARDIWARAGVLVNELARPALVLNLSAPNLAATLGEPAYLSLRQLLRTPPGWQMTGMPVFVCENPNLLAIAADRLGAHCAPLVCTDGMPAAAQRALLTQLAHAGARLLYHGDFDWPGIQIANHVLRTWQARPWRLAASDYEAAACAAPHVRRDLTDASVAATWDSQLEPAMQHHGLAIAEEALADSLIEDLRPT
jgi:uncharacterized protein (TIGR02679 family)